MNPRREFCRIVLLLALLLPALSFAAEPLRREWTVDGTTREALIFAPQTKTSAAPVVFVFHGHGGNMNQAARSFGIEKLWPEALVIYPQGLNTPGRLTDPEGKRSGWQPDAGEAGDRDLKFVDAMLATVRSEFHADERRIFATGHSNGGAFSYLLWAERGDRFAAVAPSAAVYRGIAKLKPKPVLHVAGEQDALVKFEWQRLMISSVQKVNGTGEGKPWQGIAGATIYESSNGTPVVTLIHPGTHQFPAAAPAAIVRFFQSIGSR